MRPDRWPKWIITDGMGTVRGIVCGTRHHELAMYAARHLADGLFVPTIAPITAKDLVILYGFDWYQKLEHVIWAEYIAPNAHVPRVPELVKKAKAS